MEAQIVVDLSFGDGGKGITTDYLCSLNPENSLVIRYNGGQQAGHNVVLNGKSHVHSSFGSGTLRGVPSYFSEYCTIYPASWYREWLVFKNMGVEPRFSVHPLAKVTTPYDLAYNRINEENCQHGTCGMGVGATMKRHLTSGYKVHAIDMTHEEIFRRKVNNTALYYRSFLPAHKYDELLEVADKEFDDYFRPRIPVEDYNMLDFENIIFEGAQGIMLDMDHGIFPNVTYSNTTSKNAIEICNRLGIFPDIYYVTRCYQTRHGNGWMSNHIPIDLINNEQEINTPNEWQGTMRFGELDYNLLNFALSVDDIYSGLYSANKNLVVTCLDQRPKFKMEYGKINTQFSKTIESYSPESKYIVDENYI